MASNFSSVPILDWSLTTSPDRKPEFLAQLRHALINVGFLYLSNPPVARADIDAVVDYAPRLFDLPQAAKDKLLMANSEHFLGYSKLGAEITKGRTDQREQYDFATPYEARWKPGEPEYLRLWGPSQWPDEELLPGFKETFLRYLAQVEKLSYEFIGLLAEAFGLPKEIMKGFYEPRRADAAPREGRQLLQASPHPGLQVQNLSGAWIDAPPIPGTFVVNIGKALETVTQGLANATSHRVLSPPKGSTPRYSIPFFQNIAQRITVKDIKLEFSPEILQLKEQRGEVGATDSVNYTEYGLLPTGQVNLIGRVK
ncbi:hypothetical protein EVJ58_g2093 [Rhodofomes roseus]|uniref:Isopenicillin N synthase-like dioxygenase n=1 Tax=Rhodofomes roseus TaxID=34475 RepID=A0A4Y9YU31_9APHY|nr:hypothetical protein EVJ58_g2093 [Rhodofomes roseus]